VANINLYSEFAITITGPAIGLLFIYMGYRGHLSCIRRSMAKPVDVDETDELVDAEKAEGSPSDTNDEQYILAARRTRDLAVRTWF
jgi:hypothetical protein